MIVKEIPVNSAEVEGSHSDFPVYINPSEMTGWDSLTTAEAESLRFYTDEALINEIPREIVSATEQHVLVPSLTTTTKIYASYDGIRSDYNTDDTYGAEAVWDNYLVASHNGGASDSTGNSTPTVHNSVSSGAASGVTGTATEYNGSDQAVDFNSVAGGLDTSNSYTLSVWAKRVGAGGGTRLYIWGFGQTSESTPIAGINHDRNTNANRARWFNSVGGGATSTTEVPTTHFIKITARVDSGSSALLVNGGADKSTMDGASTASFSALLIGATQQTSRSNFFRGFVANAYCRQGVTTDDWEETEYNNQNDVASFWGTVTDVTPATTLQASAGFFTIS